MIDHIESLVVAHRGRGAARRAELHQAVPAALQHPAARRQVLPVHRDLARRGLPARLLHARAPPARARLLRPVLERQARARHARPARQALPVPLLRGPEPGRRSGSPCLDYYIKRCEAPCVGYVSKEDYREGIDGVIAFLSGRFRQIERELEGGCTSPRASRTSSRRRSSATGCRPSLAARAPAGRERVAGTLDAVAVARRRARRPTRRSSRCATACSPTARASTSRTRASSDAGEVAEEFLLQYYATRWRSRALIVVQRSSREGSELEVLAECSPSARRAGRDPRRRARRQAADPRARRAQRAARARPGEAQGRAPAPAARRGARRAAAGARARRAAVRIECFDISNLGGTHTVASMVVFEGGAPKKADYRRFTIRGRRRQRRLRLDGRGAGAALRAVGAPARAARRTTPTTTRFAALPTSS